MFGYNRHFLIAIGVFAAYVTASGILSFALPLLALEISGSGSGLAVIKGAGFIPNILFAIFIGVINDRLRKSTGFRAYSLLLALSMLGLLAAYLGGWITITGLAVFMIVFNAVGYALGNLQLTLVRLVVPQDKLSDAVSLSTGVNSTIITLAPALGGLALLYLGHGGVIGILTAVLCVSAIGALYVTPDEAAKPAEPFFNALIDGWRAFRANRELVMMTIAIILTNAAAGAFDVALLLKMKTGIGANEFQIGLVLAAGGVGAVIGSTFAPRLRRAMGYRLTFFVPILILSLIYAAAIGLQSLEALLLLSFADGLVATIYAIGIWSYRQETITAEHMGRVAGLTGAIFKIGMPPIIILAGWLADANAVAQAFWLACGINALAALFLMFVAGWGLPRAIRQ